MNQPSLRVHHVYPGLRISGSVLPLVSSLLLLFMIVLPLSFSVSPIGSSNPSWIIVSFLSPLPAYADADYILGPEDEISITVWDNPDLTRTARINLEGKISFPLIGELSVIGLTQLQLEKRMRDMLSDGYLKDPHVSIQVTEYRSQKVSIIGEVNSPGSYPLTKRTTVVEAIAMAGGVRQEADHEIMIVRPKTGNPTHNAVLPDQVDPNDVIKVPIREVLEGEKTRNIAVQNGDTVFVPKIKVFYITGEVKRPGQYTYMKGMTVLNAIGTAGGFTDKAATKKVKVVREKNAKKEEISIGPEGLVEPGDTVVVPESFW